MALNIQFTLESESKHSPTRQLKPHEERLIEMLWDYLKKDPENKDRRRTAWGPKTKVGLVNSVAWAMDKERDKRPL